jgi:sugar phosphate isomerase/epimerase
LAALVDLKDFRPADPNQTIQVYKALDGRTYTGAVTGDGRVDLPAVVSILRDGGYSGWLSLEYEGPADPLTIGVPRSLEAARPLLEL